MSILNAQRIESTSIKDGAFYSVMVGTGETYLVAYALALGVSASHAALLATIPITIGSFLQLICGRLFGLLRSSRQWVVTCSIIQGLMVISFGAAQILFTDLEHRFLFLICMASIYWAAGQAAGPVWNSWISQILESGRIRNFFFKRNAISQGFTLVSLLATGYILDIFSFKDYSGIFACIFIFSGIARLTSAYFLSQQPDEPPSLSTKPAPLREWLKQKYFIYAMLFMLATHTTVHISAPFFTPYMLKELNLGLGAYSFLVASMFIARMMTGYVLHGIATRLGTHIMFLFGVITIIPLPFLWTISDSYLYLVGLQVLSGLAWGCHELGLTLYLMESIPHRNRSRLLSWVNSANSIGMLVGVSFGMWLVGSGTTLTRANYELIFIASSILRVIPLFFFSPFLRAIKPQVVLFRVLGLRPTGPGLIKPLLSHRPRSKARRN